MSVNMLFVIGSPRSGTTMLERMLASHSDILGGPEPHLLTPLAHLGYWDRAEKAPYDPLAASEGLRAFVNTLPEKESDYYAACRAYCDALYGAFLEDSGKSICLDKTPAYALVLPFIRKVFPDGKYVVLTRHPLAAFSSFANSFFDGDYQAAQAYNPLLDRYVPALAEFLRQDEAPFVHVRYEDLVQNPEAWMTRICEYAGIPFEDGMIHYGKQQEPDSRAQGLGDPIGVKQFEKPSTASLNKWVSELAYDAGKRNLMKSIIANLPDADLETIGYPKEAIWQPLEEQAGDVAPPPKSKLDRYRLQRRAIVKGRGFVQRNRIAQGLLTRIRRSASAFLED